MDENAIIDGLVKNNNASYRQLYEQYYPVTEKLVIQNCGSLDEAKDIFQEVVLILHNKAQHEKLLLTASLKTYIYSISRNLWLKELQTKRKLNIHIPYEQDDSVEESIVNQEIKKNLLKKLSSALHKMTTHCKALIISMFVKNKSISVIASESGYKNTHTAQNQKYKCLEQARKEFRK